MADTRIHPSQLYPDVFDAEAAEVRELAHAVRQQEFRTECYRQVLTVYGELYRRWPNKEIEVRISYESYIWISMNWPLLAPLLERLLEKDDAGLHYRLEWEPSGLPRPRGPVPVIISVRRHL